MLIRKVIKGINRTRNIRIDNKLRYQGSRPRAGRKKHTGVAHKYLCGVDFGDEAHEFCMGMVYYLTF